jgi:hypothetical protein
MRALLEQFRLIRALWCVDKSIMQIRDAEATAVYLQGLCDGHILNLN